MEVDHLAGSYHRPYERQSVMAFFGCSGDKKVWTYLKKFKRLSRHDFVIDSGRERKALKMILRYLAFAKDHYGSI